MVISSGDYRAISKANPQVSVGQLLADLIPPREFSQARFENYVPHSEFPSQIDAQKKCSNFSQGKVEKKLFGKTQPIPVGIYLDGGFGVGKTHLLASIWHAFKGKKAFGSFISYTSLIGALGFAEAVKALGKFQLICIDEFELDDPGDTMMMSRLLNELSEKGVKFAATSNTPPNALGEGRFAAADFQREIHGISHKFQMLRIDGEDFRHRPSVVEASALGEVELGDWLNLFDKATTSLDSFDDLLIQLSKVHPSRYGHMLDGISHVALTKCHLLTDQVDALRFVAFVDRAYEAQIKMRSTGMPLTALFSADYLSGGFRKKYLRAISRLGAMSS
ncbi:MAG: cell division protein ZapE [Rhodoluna sp.]